MRGVNVDDLLIAAPLRGWAASLDEVPDAVFAERMLGDGVAIHPLDGTVHAPCTGVVRTLHAAGHAVTLLSEEGCEVLIHVGLETVALHGAGFTPLVAPGARVGLGDPLIAFDLDTVGQAASSLATPVIVTNGERFRVAWRASGAVEPGAPLLRLERVVMQAVASRDSDTVARRTVAVSLPHGLHARPSARLGACARGFAASVALIKDDRRGDVASPVELLALGIVRDDVIAVEARGRDAVAAVEAVATLILSGISEDVAPPIVAPRPVPPGIEDVPPGQLAGVTASPGLVVGPAARIVQGEIMLPERGAGTAIERSALHAAIAAARARVAELAAKGPGAARSVMEAHLALLDDPTLAAAAERLIEQGESAGAAWKEAVRGQAAMLRATGNARLIERVDDLLDVERQVLRRLAGVADASVAIPAGSVLLARDLLPSQLVALGPEHLGGVCLSRGGPTSHVAILCAGFGLPALVAMGDALSSVAEGTVLALDADAGRLHVAPEPDLVDRFAARTRQRRARRLDAQAKAHEPCRTADGARIEVFANLGSVEDARLAIASGAEGSGLLRSEFLFLERDAAPGVEEQRATYQAIADAMEGRPVIVRLLDVGGDKPASYLPIDAEENPALGLRGVRVSLRHRDMLDVQLRAILGVRPVGQCRIMVPMIASVAEVRAVRAAIDRLRAEMGIEGAVELGVMVETPAAAVTADLLGQEVDFLSIGSNDLSQYVLAMDRGNPAVADGVDALHPAVLRLIGQSCTLAAGRGRWTGLCGGLASDAAALPILLGLGVTELSAVPTFVPEAKAIVRAVTLDQCRAHAARALALGSAAEVRELAHAFARDVAGEEGRA